jgi:hypothetical protein
MAPNFSYATSDRTVSAARCAWNRRVPANGTRRTDLERLKAATNDLAGAILRGLLSRLR